MTKHPRQVAAPSLRIARGAVLAVASCLLLAGCGTKALGSGLSNAPKLSTTTTTFGLSQPTASKPVTVLVVGDSISKDLGLGLSYTLSTDPLLHLVQAGYVGSGLARPDFYDWPEHLEALVNQYHPKLVIILVGANDSQSFDVGDQALAFGSAKWRSVYTQRVDAMINETLTSGAKMLWVGAPIMADPVLSASMQTLNSIYQAQAKLHPGVEFMSIWSLFSDASGQYSEYLTNSSGQTVLARDDDGIHLTVPDGCDILAVAVIRQIYKLWHIHLGA
ncbi:MAG: DUF459 domain-containing protein [Acidimicrobiales bacterium]|jgi:hypothetical protein